MTQQKQTIKIGIQGRGSSTVEDIGIIGNLLNEDTGIILEPILEDSVFLRWEWLKNQQIDLFYEDAHVAALNECSKPEMLNRSRGPQQMRIVASSHAGAVGLMVRGDSPIRSIHDICPQTRFAVATGMGDLVYALLGLLGGGGYNVQDNLRIVEWPATIVNFDTWESNLRSVAENTADITLATPENPIVKEMAKTPIGIRFIEMPLETDPIHIANFRRFMPFGRLMPAPKHGVREIWGVNSWVGTACLWCRPDFNETSAYFLTKWFHDNYDRYKDQGNKLKNYDLESLRQTIDVAIAPIHKGTVKYFQELGCWDSFDNMRLDYNQKLMDWYCDAWKEALVRADELGIDIVSSNQTWLNFWANFKTAINIPDYRQLTDEELKDALLTMAAKRS